MDIKFSVYIHIKDIFDLTGITRFGNVLWILNVISLSILLTVLMQQQENKIKYIPRAFGVKVNHLF